MNAIKIAWLSDEKNLIVTICNEVWDDNKEYEVRGVVGQNGWPRRAMAYGRRRRTNLRVFPTIVGRISSRIQYKILSLTYKSLQYNKPSSISDLLTIQPTRSTRSSAVVTLQRPPNPSRLKISDRSFYFQAPALWNALPHHLRSHSHSSQSHSLLSLSSSQFQKQLKTHLFLHSYHP